MADPDTTTDPAPTADPPKADGEETFDRKYVEDLRRENAKYRTAAKSYEDVFDGFDDNDKRFLLDLVRDIQTSPTSAAQRAQQLAEVLGGNAAPPDDVDDESRPLTKAEVAKMLADFANNEKTTRQQEADINAVYADAEKLGYKRDTKEMVELLWVAANDCDNDVGAAHKKIEDDRQAIIDAAIEAKRADAANTPRVVRRSGDAPAGTKEIKSLKDSRAALVERLNNG